MITLLLLLAHLIGDFVLQPKSWVNAKQRQKIKSPYLYLHVLVHLALMLALIRIVIGDFSLWWVAIIVSCLHFLIDALKIIFQNIRTKKRWFFIDQLLHLTVIAAVGCYFGEISISLAQNAFFWKVITGIVFVGPVSSIIVKTLISGFTPAATPADKLGTESLENAGNYIGILERLLVFTFIVVGHWEGVGFMIAAKSVFRYSDLVQAKQRKLTEYVLIGTLLSFGLAIVSGILVTL